MIKKKYIYIIFYFFKLFSKGRRKKCINYWRFFFQRRRSCRCSRWWLAAGSRNRLLRVIGGWGSFFRVIRCWKSPLTRDTGILNRWKEGRGRKKICLHGFFAEEEAVNRLTGEERRAEGEIKKKKPKRISRGDTVAVAASIRPPGE